MTYTKLADSAVDGKKAFSRNDCAKFIGIMSDSGLLEDMSSDLEEGTTLQLDFSKLEKVARTGSNVLPVIVQHAGTGEVLILGYANAEALRYTLESGMATFWSTSRNELWIKGKTSGDWLKIAEVRVNCEQNSLLYRVIPQGEGSCHTKGEDGKARSGCYYRRITGNELAFCED